ncbi:MAG: hypothetical protein NC483_01475 [Ruminococcus sp.]|nr:hypothetical protein [Ruminococcus sp.]
MKIDGIYIGVWFQRTTLQLSEIYDFLKYTKSELALSKKKLTELHKNLDINEAIGTSYHIDGLEYLTFTTNMGISVKIFEDGLISLNKKDIMDVTMFKDIDNISDYYENKLSPAISYIFSLGAPIPKELANIKTVYPYFIVLNNCKSSVIDTLISKTENQKYFVYNNDKYEVHRGDKYYFINNKTKNNKEVERYIEEQIFIREFKAQLHRYLNLHRIIWEKIADVKENAVISGNDIIKHSNKIDGYAKTVTLIDGRINQMSTYLKTREKLVKDDDKLKESLDLIGYRYETLGNTLNYIKELWNMTENYVNSAKKLFSDLKGDVTNQSISDLTIVTSMGVGASLIGLFTDSAPELSIFGIIYFLVLAAIGFIVNKVMNTFANRRKYEINDIEYDKNIK